VNLPVVREPRLPAEARKVPASLVGSVAVLAVGTGLEWLARRMASGAARAAGRALVRREPEQSPAIPPASSSDSVTVEEVLYIRQVRLRQ